MSELKYTECDGFMWAYEDALPDDIDGKIYDFLWPVSRVIDGVRMFPWPVARYADLKYLPPPTEAER